jgi:hypothetical protein
VRYTPDWEPLAAALERVPAAGEAAGLTEAEAKVDLCGAILDRKIDVRVRIAANNGSMSGQVLEGHNVGRPPDLNPDHFDWPQSRPLRRWPVGPVGPQSYTWLSEWEDRTIDWIKLSTADVAEILCGLKASTNVHPNQQPQQVHGICRPFVQSQPGMSNEDAKSAEVERPGDAGTDLATPKKPRKGPAPGTVDRFGESDREMFNELERLQREGRKSLTAAANELATAGKLAGDGAPQSLAARLVRRYRAERGRGN